MRVQFHPDDLRIDPIERAWTIPSDWATHPDMHDIDKRSVLSRSWQYAGPASLLAQNGSHVPVTIAGEPVLLIRDDDTIRAFFNVCKHRGGPLAIEAGCGKTISCKYHGWTYRLDGSLRGVPKFDRAELFDKRDFGLSPLSLINWKGLLFVRLDDGGWEPDEVLTPISQDIKPIDVGDFEFKKRIEYTLDCDWKVYVDNYLEGYHIPHVHPELCDLLQFSEYKTRTEKWHSLQSSPINGDDSLYGEGNAFYYFVWPNIMLNILPRRMQVNSVMPIGPRKTLVWFDYYYSGDAGMMPADIEYSHQVQMEDERICEYVQKGLESRGYERGRYSVELEEGVWHFHKMLRHAYSKRLSTTLT